VKYVAKEEQIGGGWSLAWGRGGDTGKKERLKKKTEERRRGGRRWNKERVC